MGSKRCPSRIYAAGFLRCSPESVTTLFVNRLLKEVVGPDKERSEGVSQEPGGFFKTWPWKTQVQSLVWEGTSWASQGCEGLLLAPWQAECPSTPQPCGPCLGFPPGPQALQAQRVIWPPCTSSTWMPILPDSQVPDLSFLLSAPYFPPLVLCHWPCPSQPLARPAHRSWPHSRDRADNQEAQTIVDCVFSLSKHSQVHFI